MPANNPKQPLRSLTRAEIEEIERKKREENNARARQLFGSAAGAKHPRLYHD